MYVNVICEFQSTLQTVMSQLVQTQHNCNKNGQSVLDIVSLQGFGCAPQLSLWE